MIFLAKVCRCRNRKHDGELLRYTGLDRHGYANNLGFSEALNLEGRPFPQGAFGGRNYIPMSALFRDELEIEASNIDGALGDAIQGKCEEIAQIVSQGRGDALRSVVARSFCEIFRNTFEHGGSDSAVFCAQYWPNKEVVEICIADRGMGIMESLQESKHTKPENDREALYLSLMPGVSSKAWRHKKKRSHQKSVWDNAGYGLFFYHQLFGNLGSFFIASEGHALSIQPKQFDDFECRIEGTLVSMMLDLSDEQALESQIKYIADLAAKVKQRIGVKSICFESVQGFLQSGEI